MRDLSDHLSPILVKELRQGMRAHLFTGAFLLIQGLMVLFTVISLIANTFQSNNEGMDLFFWMMIGIPLLLMMPASGARALSSERKEKTLELLFLTRLTAYRIVLGKWLAVFSQTLILASAVLPYIVLRYFLGGVNLWSDLLVLVIFLAVSGLFTAVTVGTSAVLSPWLRWGILLIGGYFVLMFMSMSISMLFYPGLGIGGITHPWILLVVLFCFGVLITLLTFEVGTTQIAPPAENRSTRIRLLGFLALGLGVASSYALDKKEACLGVTLVLLLPLCVASLCEQVRLIPSLYSPFVRRGRLGRMAGTFLYPGWASGIVFTLIISGVFLIAFFDLKLLGERIPLIVSFYGTLFFPIALLKTVLRKIRRTFTFYFLIQMFMTIPIYVFGIAVGMEKFKFAGTFRHFLGFFPPSYFVFDLFLPGSKFSHKGYERFSAFSSVTVCVLTGLVFLVLLVAVRRTWNNVRKMEQEALENDHVS